MPPRWQRPPDGADGSCTESPELAGDIASCKAFIEPFFVFEEEKRPNAEEACLMEGPAESSEAPSAVRAGPSGLTEFLRESAARARLLDRASFRLSHEGKEQQDLLDKSMLHIVTKVGAMATDCSRRSDDDDTFETARSSLPSGESQPWGDLTTSSMKPEISSTRC